MGVVVGKAGPGMSGNSDGFRQRSRVDKVMLAAWVDPELRRAVKIRAAELGVSLEHFVSEAVRVRLEESEGARRD